ncbi:MAG TPA: tripartite tricarboxylate transporter TctB family protein [Thermodesulfobacteriota bacterium]|nr:tripartite tricarboxylate transporter TctB family protein [Thermodesulfobacteriota bacterium]
MKNRDLVSSLFCLILGLVFVGGGLKMGIGPMNGPGPGFFPAAIGGVLSSLSAVLFVISARKRKASASERFWKAEKSWVKIFICLVSLVFYLAFLDYLGYIVTTTLFIFSLLRFVGKKGWVPSIVMAVVVSFSTYAIFRMGLGVLLPKGVFRF